MSIHDLKQRMSDVPGIETLTMVMMAGRQQYNLAGKVVALDAAASDIDVEAAIRAAMSSDAIAQIPAGTPLGPDQGRQIPDRLPSGTASAEGDSIALPQAGEASPVSGTSPATNNTAQSKGTATTDVMAPSPSAALIPTVSAIEPQTIKPQAPSMSVTGAKFAGLNLKAQLNAVRSTMEANSAKMAQAIGEMQDAANQHGQLADTIASEAASLKADMAEFTNGSAE